MSDQLSEALNDMNAEKFQGCCTWKLKWDWNYTYSEDQSIRLSQIFYNVGKHYGIKEL